MVGPFGSPDDVWLLKEQMLYLAAPLFMILATSTPLAPFERYAHDVIKQSDEMLGYYLAKGLWTFALLWWAFAWWLALLPDGLGFNLQVGFFATMTFTALTNILWPHLFFVDSETERRTWLSMGTLVLGWLSAIAALILLSINMWQNWAALTLFVPAVISAIFVFVYVLLMVGVFIFYYTMSGELGSTGRRILGRAHAGVKAH